MYYRIRMDGERGPCHQRKTGTGNGPGKRKADIMEAALRIETTPAAIARLSVIGNGPVRDRAHAAIELLLRRSAGRRLMVVGFFSSEKFRREFRTAFEELAGPEDRLIIENARSRRIRGLDDVARRAWLYGRLGACAAVVETGRDETARNIIAELGVVPASHRVPLVVVPGEHLDAELSNGWRVSYLCQQADTNPAHLLPEQVERIPVQSAGGTDRGNLLKVVPDLRNLSDGAGSLIAGGSPGLPQLGLGF